MEQQGIEEGNRPSMDYKFGYLIGEIIWLSKLGRYTENALIESFCTKEEKDKYESLNRLWFEKVGIKTEKVEAPEEWSIYRNYTRQLHIKYFPETIEFGHWLNFHPENIKKLYDGIVNFLWNTDECGYTFEESDIKIEPFRKDSKYLKIKFTLDYLHPKSSLFINQNNKLK